jgi:hypothetical protein
MAQDPVSAVASWLTPATPEIPEAADPVLTLFAEPERLVDRYDSVYYCAACEIEATLPDDVGEGRVLIEMLDGGTLGFRSEELLKGLLDSRMSLAETRFRHYPEDGDERDPVREWSEKAIKDFRTGKANIAAVREASGCEALFRQASDLDKQADEIVNRACNMQAVSLAGLLAQIERLRHLAAIGFDVDPLIDTIIAGIKGLSPQPAAVASDMNQLDSTLLAAEQRLAELRLAEEETYRAYREAGQPIGVESEQELICDVFDDEIITAQRIIDETPPQSLVGAAVKLRRLATKEDDGLEQPLSYASVRQVLGFLRLSSARSLPGTMATEAAPGRRCVGRSKNKTQKRD